MKQEVTFYDRDQSDRLHRRLAISDLGFASRLGRPLILTLALFTVQLYLSFSFLFSMQHILHFLIYVPTAN
jgi:hypothetical protein